MDKFLKNSSKEKKIFTGEMQMYIDKYNKTFRRTGNPIGGMTG